MNKRPFFRVIILVLLFLSACAAPGTSADGFLKVSLKDLFANPLIYNGKELCTDGIYLKAFEVSALADSYEIKDNYRSLVGPNIWVEHPAMETFECVEESDRFGKFCMVVVCGKFEYGGQYGHLGGYQYMLSEIKPFSGRLMYFPETRQAVPVVTTP
jgi:hypothetical protein